MNTLVNTASAPSTALPSVPPVISSVTTITPSTSPPPSLPPSLTLAARRAELQSQLEQLAQMEKEAVKEQQEKLAAAVRSIPLVLGLNEGDLNGAFMLIKAYMKSEGVDPKMNRTVTAKKRGRPPGSGNKSSTVATLPIRARTSPIPESVINTAIKMRKAGDTAEQIARHLGVSVASCWIWFRNAGLSGKGLGGKAHRRVNGKGTTLGTPSPVSAEPVAA